MNTKRFDVVIIGSGPGGLASAIAAKKNGVGSVLIIERDLELGGILLQCIHNGFGVEIFKEDLPGPTYAQRFIDEVRQLGIETMLDTIIDRETGIHNPFIFNEDASQTGDFWMVKLEGLPRREPLNDRFTTILNMTEVVKSV